MDRQDEPLFGPSRRRPWAAARCTAKTQATSQLGRLRWPIYDQVTVHRCPRQAAGVRQ